MEAQRQMVDGNDSQEAVDGLRRTGALHLPYILLFYSFRDTLWEESAIEVRRCF